MANELGLGRTSVWVWVLGKTTSEPRILSTQQTIHNHYYKLHRITFTPIYLIVTKLCHQLFVQTSLTQSYLLFACPIYVRFICFHYATTINVTVSRLIPFSTSCFRVLYLWFISGMFTLLLPLLLLIGNWFAMA